MRVVLYHGDCPDGFGAAWSCYRSFGTDGTVYKPAGYGGFDPTQGLTHADDVYCVDYCPPLPVARKLAAHVNSLTIYDHHITSLPTFKALTAEYPGVVRGVHDTARSGAGITWDSLHGYAFRPWLIDYVEDRDLFVWRLHDSQAVCYGIDTYDRSFELWDGFAATAAPPVELIEHGQLIADYVARQVQAALQRTHVTDFYGVADVPQVNSCLFASEIGNTLLSEHPDAPFAVVWYTRNDGTIYHSLRSTNERTNVAQFAQDQGGGGHRNASGFVERRKRSN